MATPQTPSLSVRGGAGGIEAHYDDLLSLARLFGRAAAELAQVSLRLNHYLLDPGLLSGGVVDPAGGARFAAELGAATDGPHGVSWIAARCGLSDVKLRAAAAAYEAEDFALSRADVLNGALKLPGAFAASAQTYLRTNSLQAAGQRLVTADPELADDVVVAAGGVDGPAANALSTAVVDGPPVVRRLGADPATDSRTPPRSMRDVMVGLERRSDARHGAVDVRLLVGTDGRRRAIVDIPGTKSWDPLPNGDITSLATNLRAVRGAATGYERGVLMAMQQAGVRASDEVMLVGHSQGGMIAVNTAIAAHDSGQFRITHVVTAGSPIGALTSRVPPEVEVLALENTHDVVPHTDGRMNDARPNVTTVTFAHDEHSATANHGWHAYVPGAAAVDASDDPSVKSFMAGADVFLDAKEVRTERFVITRAR